MTIRPLIKWLYINDKLFSTPRINPKGRRVQIRLRSATERHAPSYMFKSFDRRNDSCVCRLQLHHTTSECRTAASEVAQ